ncbi:hypothetical protein [Jiella sp. M17.18]|uniref:hypothetical protein n=1 Tax=Jiella sp. M17.18 TaxID=3234247 RepID=UPI0034E00BE9
MLPRLALLTTLLAPTALAPTDALAQPFDPGPPPGVPGSSMSGMTIGGAPPQPDGVRIRGAHVFGETVEQRAYGRDYDDSYLHPDIAGGKRGKAPTTEERAMEGRGDLNGVNAGSFARGGPAAIGRSTVTRGRSTGPHRAIIRRPSHAPRNGSDK